MIAIVELERTEKRKMETHVVTVKPLQHHWLMPAPCEHVQWPLRSHWHCSSRLCQCLHQQSCQNYSRHGDLGSRFAIWHLQENRLCQNKQTKRNLYRVHVFHVTQSSVVEKTAWYLGSLTVNQSCTVENLL